MLTEAEKAATLWIQTGFTDRTVIQAAVAEPLLAGQSVVGVAPTGSGKTLAYGIPALSRLVPGAGLQLVIIVPAQELAIQIRDVLTPLAKTLGLGFQGLIGSANRERQVKKLREKPEAVVATLGRFVDLLEERKVVLEEVKTLIVDEFDSFEPDALRDILSFRRGGLPKQANLGLFSATDNPTIVSEFQAAWPDLQVINETSTDNSRGVVHHLLLDRQQAGKIQVLENLAREKHQRVFVFFNHKHVLQKVASELRFKHVPASMLVTDGRQVQRAEALQDFRSGRVPLLLTTDVAARGLDVADVTAVVNFELPDTLTTYIHRTGRTGRQGANGTVYNLGDDHDLRDLRKLVGDRVALETEPGEKKAYRKSAAHSAGADETRGVERQTGAGHRPGKRLTSAEEEAASAKKRKKKKQRWRNKKNVGKHW
ncbi:DEAD/DEAH box helicase [Schleiferilactobacillus shenzhenensis]|uniref:Uncharacterized protein n=1 Tax=Schleiferilactobacillus shenzhenensis LY-73 TaxID=1231336 RepID=U4TRU8_9LACO|nr:DEAD/DEAH box helicase [Schleiferilactobacillus shenzhenensis]ERL64217.1 hypothetical protein L248_1495 [Schleiferilactobacillus shenzhenensis LY-73]